MTATIPDLIQTAVPHPVLGDICAPKGRPAIIAVGGIQFSSEIPACSGEAVHVNEIARRICQQP